MNLLEEKKRYIEKLNNPTQKDLDDRSYEFAVFSASMVKFFPEISISKHFTLFKDYMYHTWISGLEQYDMEYLDKSTFINNTTINIKSSRQKEPLIFASFHFGSFRLLNSILYEMGHKVVIIIDQTVFQKQEKQMLNDVVPLLRGTQNSDLIFLNVMDRKSIFKLKKLIQDGYIMTVYLDGNTGINSDGQIFEKGYIPITFLKKKIYVKNGIGKLAVILNATIIPAVSVRDNEENNHITFYKEIRINDFLNKQDFAVKSIENIYKIFEEELIKNPMQWGSWLNIHKWFKRDYTTPFNTKDKNEKCYDFNTERYKFFKVKKSYFIFDLFDYKSYSINEDLYESINSKNIANIELNLYNELKNKTILI